MAAASRAHVTPTGSSVRQSKAEQARFEKTQRSHSRTAGKRPGNQKTQSAHKKNLIVGRKKLTGRLGPPNSGTRNVFFADSQGKGGESYGKGGEGKGKGKGKGGRSSGSWGSSGGGGKGKGKGSRSSGSWGSSGGGGKGKGKGKGRS